MVVTFTAPAGVETFTNPIVGSGADPWVVLWRDDYYYCRVGVGGKICVGRSKRLHDIGEADMVEAWSPPENTAFSKNIWAPELHYLDERWYLYFAADDGHNANHRMYVLESTSQNPQGAYTFKGKIAAPVDRWAIDGTVLSSGDGSKYFIWSGWENFENVRQSLYIAPMSNPWTISADRVCISSPEYAWEQAGVPHVNEGPQVLERDGKIHIIYSASGSWTDDYCLGQLTLVGGDVLRAESWAKRDAPVFAKTSEVFGPGHACFVKSPDGREDWIVYHAAKHSGAGWDRDIRTQKFTWNEDGSPNFGVPVPAGVPVKKHSGDFT